MQDCGQKHVFEEAGDVGPYGTFQIGRTGAADDTCLTCSGKVIGPELAEPFAQRGLGPSPAVKMLAQPDNLLYPRFLIKHAPRLFGGECFGRAVVWSHPAFADKCLFARNDSEIVCINLSAEPTSR